LILRFLLFLKFFVFLKEIEMHRSFLPTGTRTLLSLAVLGASALVAGNAGAAVLPPTFNAPGIPVAGFPDFTNNNNVSLVFSKVDHTSDYALVAYGTAGAFNMTSTKSYGVNNEVFAMYATFNSSGKFLSGGETFFGNIPGLTSNSFQNLYTVSFDKYAVSTSPTVGLGFDTVVSTASGWAKQFQTQNESLYLYSASMASLDNALKSGHGLPSYFSATVSSFATVPLPAAAWLFGPALAGLFGSLRRRRSDSAVLDAASA
jgi:hypothetical protein